MENGEVGNFKMFEWLNLSTRSPCEIYFYYLEFGN